MKTDDYVQYLMVLDHLNRTSFDTFGLLVHLHDTLTVPSDVQATRGAYFTLLLRLRIIEVVCEYIELLGDYSVACKETGLLYPTRVLSVASHEVAAFFAASNSLADDEIIMLLNPKLDHDPDEIAATRATYSRVSTFRSDNWSLYNAIKHGMRVYPLEIANKGTEDHEDANRYLSLQWVHVQQGQEAVTHEQAHTWDERIVELSIRSQEIRCQLIPAKDLSAYRSVMDDCHGLVETILANHAPDWNSGDTILD